VNLAGCTSEAGGDTENSIKKRKKGVRQVAVNRPLSKGFIRESHHGA
jgi:hypothetical protein